MSTILFLLLLVFISCSLAALTQQQKDDLLTYHNEARALKCVGPMTWDDALSNTAQAWADGGNEGHNPNRTQDYANFGGIGSVGENVAGGSWPSYSLKDHFDAWVSEESVPCNTGGGHYTQVLWEQSTKLGCGFKLRPNGKWGTIVCNYNPAGNFGNGEPFAGSKCTDCDPGNVTSTPTPSTTSTPTPSTTSTPTPSGTSTPTPFATPTPSGLPDGFKGPLTDAERLAILEAHNTKRASRCVPRLEWDSTLEEVAQDFADRGVFSINSNRHEDYQNLGGDGYIGENVAGFFGDAKDTGVKNWASAEGQPCNNGTGQYKQLMWENSKKVGCGYKILTAYGGMTFLVCNYQPTGNYIGQDAFPLDKCTNCISARNAAHSGANAISVKASFCLLLLFVLYSCAI